MPLPFWCFESVLASVPATDPRPHPLPLEDGFSHYSLTVHGCRIAFLYWPLLESARPVKFLWKLEQVRLVPGSWESGVDVTSFQGKGFQGWAGHFLGASSFSLHFQFLNFLTPGSRVLWLV